MQNIWKHPAWVAIPVVTDPKYLFSSYDEMPDYDVTVKLRMANPYFVGIGDFASKTRSIKIFQPLLFQRLKSVQLKIMLRWPNQPST
jgi:hypothetical protein